MEYQRAEYSSVSEIVLAGGAARGDMPRALCGPTGPAGFVLTLLLLLLQARGDGDDQLTISIVESSPVVAQELAAAVEVAGGAAAVAAVEPGEALATAEHACQAAGHSEAVLTTSGRLVGPAAARAGLPLLLARPASQDEARDALALLPPDPVMAEAVAAVVLAKGWHSAVLLHAGPAIPAALLAPQPEPLSLVARRLPHAGDEARLRNLLLVLKKAGARNFIVWCDAACCVRVLEAAQRAGLLDQRYSYVLVAEELRTWNLEPYSHSGANVTALLLFDPDSPRVQAAERMWRERYALRVPVAAREGPPAPSPVPVRALLALDAASLLAEARRRLQLPSGAGADCARGRGAMHGESLLNWVRSEEQRGVTGSLLAWDAAGRRQDCALTVAELQRGGRLSRAGDWTPPQGLRWARPPRPTPPLPPGTMLNRTFNVLIARNKPYVMKRDSDMRLSGNERYEGFCIELIQRLAEILKFQYTFVEQEDGLYGNYHPDTGRWDGMLGRLMTDDDVHFAITDLTMTAERVNAVDFTTPFMTLGIAILFRTPRTPEPDLFAFLLPFSWDVWVWLGLSYAGCSLLLWVIGRLCPQEWQNPYPCVEEPEELDNQFTLPNALWFNLGALLLQGSEVAPVAYGSRAAASVWFLFALVITSSYTANLASLLAKKTSDQLIHDVHDLANNTMGISYGAKAGGSTYTFFEHAQSELFQTMYEHMKDQKMPETNDVGIKWVVESDYKYAFLMESTSIEYEIERNCAVTMVGDLLDSKGYGIAMKKNSPYRQEMNLALLRLQEAGVLRQMKHTWWKERHGGGACKQLDDNSSTKLSMKNFRGLWLVLVVGCALGLAVSVLELLVRAHRQPRGSTEPYFRRVLHELRFVFRFDRSVKPVQGPLLTPTPPPSSGSGSGSGRSRSLSALREVDFSQPRATSTPHSPARRRRSSMQAAHSRLARHTDSHSIRSPRASIRSPRASIRSPRESIRSPRESIRSPRESIRSPRASIRSPRRPSQRSPHRSPQRSPHRLGFDAVLYDE